MENKILNIIGELKILLSENYTDFIGIYLFGSQSKKITPAESDYDLAIIFEREINRKFKNEIIDLIYSFDLKYEIVLDVKIFSAKEISEPVTPFRRSIKETGLFYGLR